MKESSAPIESTIAQSQQMITRHHDAPAGPPFHHVQQIVAEARLCTSASVQFGVNCESHLGRIDIRRQLELGVSGIIVASAAV